MAVATPSIEALNQRFGITNQLRFVSGPSDFPIADIVNDSATAQVALHGAHVLGYTPQGQRPLLWLSDKAIYKDGSALRGGIPVIWPWFGAHPTDSHLGAHGFVRNHSWEVLDTQTTADGATIIRFQYDHHAPKPEQWQQPFRLTVTVAVGKELVVTLSTQNTGQESISYTAALHTYFAVSDVRKVEVAGLDGVGYLNKPTNFTHHQQSGPVTFNGEVDRVYQATTATCSIFDKAWNRTIRVAKKGSATTVVWNPGSDVVKAMSDFPDDHYTDMVCVETANAFDDVVIVPAGGRAELSTVISAV